MEAVRPARLKFYEVKFWRVPLTRSNKNRVSPPFLKSYPRLSAFQSVLIRVLTTTLTHSTNFPRIQLGGFDIINRMLKMQDKEKRLAAFDALTQLKTEGVSRDEIIKMVSGKFSIPAGTLYTWHSGDYLPFGRKGKVIFRPELFYVLGALLGEGCGYKWRITKYFYFYRHKGWV